MFYELMPQKFFSTKKNTQCKMSTGILDLCNYSKLVKNTSNGVANKYKIQRLRSFTLLSIHS